MPQYLSPGVYVEEIEPSSRPIEGVSTSIAAFVGLAEKGPFNSPTLVTNWSQFTNTFGEFVEGSYLAHSVYGFFNNGGSVAYIVRVGKDGGADASSARAELPSAADKSLGAFTVSALESGTAGNELQVEIVDASEGTPEETFKLVVKRGNDVVEEFDNLTVKRGRTNVATVVNAQSKLIKIETASSTALEHRPANTALNLNGGGVVDKPSPVTPDDYVGDAADRTGFGGLEAIEDITMVAVPDLVAALEQGAIDKEQFRAVQLAIIAHCELMGNRMAILDSPGGMTAQGMKEWRSNGGGYDSKYAALYWPHLKVFDPASGHSIFVPPSGHMAGIWCRSDSERGVHKAPANEVVRGAISLETNITKGEHDQLNPLGVNCIRSFPGRGIRVWGARTLSSDASWRYINVRRLFNYVESSILNGTQWVVFEPNDQELWGRIKRTINGFLYTVWMDGALFGTTAQQAFYVKCDDETNPSEVIEQGRVVTEIGIAPTKPAEFVVFRLANLPTGTSAVSE